MMTDAFITVREAATMTGKSDTSIRRLIVPIIKAENHPDRVHILPTVEEVLQLRIKGESFAWKIEAAWLAEAIPLGTPGDRRNQESDSDTASSGLIAMLQKELEIKNSQISQANAIIGQHAELISGLTERIREGNVLIGTLQERLALTDGRGEPATSLDAVVTPPAKSVKMEKGTAAPKTKPRRGLFRFFR